MRQAALAEVGCYYFATTGPWRAGQRRANTAEIRKTQEIAGRETEHAEAAEYWRQYLANDGQSEWAARARRSLKFCEMQIHLSASAISGG
jgi:hypothetical protein